MRKIILAGLSSICLSIVFGIGPASAHSDNCTGNYGIAGSSFTTTTGWINLGSVTHGIGGASMKNKCKNKAVLNCSRAEGINLIHQYAPVATQNFQNICTSGSISIYYDTDLPAHEGKKTKDGTCSVAIRCTRPPCPWTGYSAREDLGGAKVAQVKSTSSNLANCQIQPRPSL